MPEEYIRNKELSVLKVLAAKFNILTQEAEIVSSNSYINFSFDNCCEKIWFETGFQHWLNFLSIILNLETSQLRAYS